MAPPLFAKSCVVVLTIAVAVSRLMSTNGRAIRVQHQQPALQRHHSTGLEDGVSYSDPELDIDRLYEMISDNRAADRIQQQRQHPHQQLLKPRPPPSRPAAAAASADAGIAAAVISSAAGPAPALHQPPATQTADSQQQQHSINQTTAAHAAEPRYHFEVHSVQHTGQPFQTAEQKLRTVIRQMAAVQYHLKDVGDDGKQTLLDDNELHQKRMASSVKTGTKTHLKPDSGNSMAAAAAAAELEARYRIEQEQLRQLLEQEQRYYDEGELDDEEMQEPYEPEAEIAAPKLMSSKPDSEEIDKRPNQKSAVDGKAADEENSRQPSETREQEVGSKSSNDDGEESEPLALPVKSDGDVFERSSLHGSTRSASSIADIYFLAVVIGCAVAGIAGFMFAGLCWYRLHRKMKEAGDVDYPAYGVTGPAASTTTKSGGGVVTMPGGTAGSPGDRKLAQSAQMYHYQHQKQQMIASERLSSDVNQQVIGGNGSDVESEEENEDGDYTVFECPGLATNGEMEVRNPMFNDPTPVGTPADTASLYGQTKK